MKEVLLIKIDGARLSACENGLFFDCDAGTILILWEQIEAAQQMLALDPPSAPSLPSTGTYSRPMPEIVSTNSAGN